MVEMEDFEVQNVEEFLEDKDSEIFDTILLNDNVETAKNKLKILKDWGIITHGVFSSYFFYFSLNKPQIV